MLSTQEYKDIIARIKEMSAEEFIKFIDCAELSEETKQLLYDRFGRNKIKWWNKYFIEFTILFPINIKVKTCTSRVIHIAQMNFRHFYTDSNVF